jgi:hypothetical protein
LHNLVVMDGYFFSCIVAKGLDKNAFLSKFYNRK